MTDIQPEREAFKQIIDEYEYACSGIPMHWERSEKAEAALQQALAKLEALLVAQRSRICGEVKNRLPKDISVPTDIGEFAEGLATGFNNGLIKARQVVEEVERNG